MTFTATATYLMLALAASKAVEWRIYFRKTTSLTDTLSSGTWTEITHLIPPLSPHGSKIEYDPGQLSRDTLEIETLPDSIEWLDANMLNATASEHIEIKVMFTLGDASDTVYTFSGYVDKRGIRKSELAGNVTLTVMTAEGIGSRISAESITARYVDDNIDGSGTDGLTLPGIQYLFVKNANISSYVLTYGTHTLTYDYNSGTPRVKLDGSRWQNLSAGATTIGNGETSDLDTQKVELYTPSLSLLPQTTVDDYIVVTTEGDTLPRTWFRFTSAKTLIRRCMTKLGITTLTEDSTEISTASGSKISFLDLPPNDDEFSSVSWALVGDGTDLWVGIGNKLYKRTMSTDTYELKATFTSGRYITRLWHNARNGHIWVALQSSKNPLASYNLYIARHVMSSGSNSSEVALTGGSRYAIDLMDFNYTGSSYTYGLVYVDITNRAIRFVDGSAVTDGLLFSQGDLGYGGSDGPANGYAYVNNRLFRYQAFESTTFYVSELENEPTSGSWVNNGQQYALDEGYVVGARHATENRVYFWSGADSKVKSHLESGATRTDVLTLSGENLEGMQYFNGNVYINTPKMGYIYSIASNTATQIHDGKPYVYGRFYQFAYNDRLYGLDGVGRLYQYHTTVHFYTDIANFTGMSVTDALYKVLRAFNMVINIAPNKTAKIYKRGDSSGTPVTSGSSVALTVSEVSDIRYHREYVLGVTLAEVSNGERVVTYNGSAFNTSVLSDAKIVSISNDLVPTHIMRDVCKYVYEYFKTAHDMCTVRLGNVPLYQYEPFDEASITFTTTKIQKTATGVIYAVHIIPPASMEVETLI